MLEGRSPVYMNSSFGAVCEEKRAMLELVNYLAQIKMDDEEASLIFLSVG